MTVPLNVLVVVLDGVRADHLSCYGYQRETTPVLDGLAREGVRFANMISTAPSTLPAHAALLTGLHSVTHGATSEHPRFVVRGRFLPESLRTAGYRTAAFSTNPWVSPETGFGRGFDAFFTQRYQSRLAMRAVAFGRRTADRLLQRTDGGARRTNLAMARWLAGDQRPFFALVHYNEAHLPVSSPPPFERLFINKTPDLERARALNSGDASQSGGSLGQPERALLSALYDGALRYVDQRVGELADVLRADGRWNNTLVIVTADHGESLGEHNTVGHASGLHDSLLRVPLLMRCPERLPAGFVIDELAQTTDILPTVLALTGIADDTPPAQGRALVRDGRATPGPEFVVSERFRPPALPGAMPVDDVRMKAIRTRRDKFIWRSDEANELYDLIADPLEQHNVVDRCTPRADGLRRQLFDWLASVENFDAGERQEVALLESTA